MSPVTGKEATVLGGDSFAYFQGQRQAAHASPHSGTWTHLFMENSGLGPPCDPHSLPALAAP